MTSARIDLSCLMRWARTGAGLMVAFAIAGTSPFCGLTAVVPSTLVGTFGGYETADIKHDDCCFKGDVQSNGFKGPFGAGSFASAGTSLHLISTHLRLTIFIVGLFEYVSAALRDEEA